MSFFLSALTAKGVVGVRVVVGKVVGMVIGVVAVW